MSDLSPQSGPKRILIKSRGAALAAGRERALDANMKPLADYGIDKNLASSAAAVAQAVRAAREPSPPACAVRRLDDGILRAPGMARSSCPTTASRAGMSRRDRTASARAAARRARRSRSA